MGRHSGAREHYDEYVLTDDLLTLLQDAVQRGVYQTVLSDPGTTVIRVRYADRWYVISCTKAWADEQP